MKTMTRIMIGLAVSVLLPTAAAMAQKVSYDYDRDTDFTRYRTYAFKESPTKETTEEPTTYDNPLVQERIKEAVTAQLEGRGLRRVEEHPDVYVITHRTYETQKNYTVYNPYGWGWGYGPYGYGWGSGIGWGWGPGYSDVQVRDIVIGTLTIDLEDAATGELVWRGVGEKRVHMHSSPEHRDKRVTKAVAKIFKNFPSAGAVATSGH